MAKFKLNKPIFVILFVFLTISSFCQTKFGGKVIDSKTKEPLAFVNIIYSSSNYGTTTDLDGYFTIESYDKIEFLKVSYLGYITKTITKEEIGNKRYFEIQLEENAFYLSEVTILPGINPAHRIIDEVINNADRNNPEKMRSFSYMSYSRFHITVGFNIAGSITVLPKKEELKTDSVSVLDTTGNKEFDRVMDVLTSQYLFLSENVSERKFSYPDNNKETVLAQRVSGLKNPSFVLLGSQFQSLSFYKDYITILDKKYLSPVSKGSTKRYFFQIEDTMYNEKADTIFIISYRPLHGKNFEGMQGVMHINTNGYAIQNVSAKPYEKSKTFDINIQQKYELIEDTQWFPVQLNTDIIINMIEVIADSISIPCIGIGKTYISDISLNPDHKRKDFNQLNVVVNDDASKKDETFWNTYRKEALTEKDLKTYEVIDSLGDEFNFDRFLNVMEIVASGYIPFKFINFDLLSIYNYNKYEGSRLGLGLSTNDRMLTWASAGGYFAYGFRDKAWKYGGHLSFLFHRPSETKLILGYKKDLSLSDDYTFQQGQALSFSNYVMDMFLSEMDSVTQYYASFQFSTLKYLRANVMFSYTEKNIINQDRYNYREPLNMHYFNSEIGIYLRYAYKEKFMQTPRGNRISLGTKYPILHFNITKSIPLFDADNDYFKYEASVYKKFVIRNAGETHLQLTGGLIDGIAPYSELYYIAGISSWLNFDNVFNTMRINEFISDRFACAFVRHDFGSLLWKGKKFSPKFAIVTAAGWGDAKLVLAPEEDYQAKLMNKGYYESGLQINGIITMSKLFGYGLGVYYRYGPYSRTKEIENWAFKLTLTLNM
ncbi:MAG: DUF5686 and carboxypeptidase regulatory-like domain-containing protein [Bacteroidales bacterium]|jgi:hypothetical protein|nr:DUF5686 and carboxypeptidase regulatory-like domain-containing protein [Bacteroidales bacterium]